MILSPLTVQCIHYASAHLKSSKPARQIHYLLSKAASYQILPIRDKEYHPLILLHPICPQDQQNLTPNEHTLSLLLLYGDRLGLCYHRALFLHYRSRCLSEITRPHIILTHSLSTALPERFTEYAS